MSDQTRIPASGQTRARSEEAQRSASPTSTDLSTSSAMSSPGPGRKRTNGEISSTGADTSQSKELAFCQRPRTALEKNHKVLQPSHFEQHGFPKHTLGPAAQSSDSTVASLSTQPSNISTAATAPDTQQMFVSRLQGLQAQLDLEYDQYEKDLEKRDHKAQIEPYDWNNLECRYLEDMEPAIKSEQDIQTNIAQQYGRMLLWMQASSDRETHRAIKRLRTRIAFVQNSEVKLAEKERHYEKVLKAFQSTLALLA